MTGLGRDPAYSPELGDQRHFISVWVGDIDDGDDIGDDLWFCDPHTVVAQLRGGSVEIVDPESDRRSPGTGGIGDDL